MPTEIKWNSRFNIGVDSIDHAHQKLFMIVGKLIALNEDETKQQHACREGIKYFKSYTLKHFTDEEAYMQSVGYTGYAMHKSLHDNMRDKTLPALEAELEAQDYSVESVRHFLGLCIGWLNGHIMVEDRAITGKNANKWVHKPSEDELDSLTKAILQGLQMLCQANSRVVSLHYGGENFSSGNTLCYRLTYSPKKRNTDLKPIQLYLVYEESLILRTLSEILDEDIKRIDKTSMSAMKLLSEQFVNHIKSHFTFSQDYCLAKNDMMTFDQFVRVFDKTCPPYSLLFNTEGKGYFAFCAIP
ncbi:MAG: hemerythrin domain-containing protein [Lachnospiraceae bacterium]|nr:hemerythrin domain-containing protein [Lachnospiraceae bacterium]